MATPPARTVRSDRERAADELAVYEVRLRKAFAAYQTAKDAAEEAFAELERNRDVYDHLRRHPAFGEDQPPTADRVLFPMSEQPHGYVAQPGTSDGSCAVQTCGLSEAAPVHDLPPEPVTTDELAEAVERRAAELTG